MQPCSLAGDNGGTTRNQLLGLAPGGLQFETLKPNMTIAQSAKMCISEIISNTVAVYSMLGLAGFGLRSNLQINKVGS